MGLTEILKKSNYYSESNEKQGWSIEINNEIIKSNPQIITPEKAEEIKKNIQPKETFTNVIENYDTIRIAFEKNLNQFTKQENLGRSR